MSNPFRSRRITDDLVARSLNECRRRFPGKKFIVLADQPLNAAILAERPESVPDLDVGYLLAYEQDDTCATIMAHIVSIGKLYFPCLQYYPVSEYWRTNKAARDVLTLEYDLQTKKPGHKWNTPDFVNIVQAIDATRNVNGDFVEVGVFRGSSARVAVRYMDYIKIERSCWFMDVFIGFNYEEAKDSVDRLWEGSHQAGDPEALADELRSCMSPSTKVKINVLKHNIISDTLPRIPGIAVANLDVDMYEAVRAGLFCLAPLISPGGILIVEDPGHTPALSGAFHALHEFLNNDISTGFVPLTMGSGQTFLIRKGT